MGKNENTIKNERAQRCRVVRGMTNKSISVFAEKAHVNEQTIKAWENAIAGGLTEKGAEKFATTAIKFGVECTPIWLLYGLGVQPKLTGDIFNKSAEKIHYKNTSPIVNVTKINKSKIIKKEIDLFKKHYGNNCITVQIKDKSMFPAFIPDDIVGGIISNNISDLIDQYCIVEIANKHTLCRLLQGGSKKNVFNLITRNPESPYPQYSLYDEPILSAAKIIRLWRNE